MVATPVPITNAQVEAAIHIRRQLPYWQVTDEALGILAKLLPGLTVPETLLKIAAINQLYGTNLYAVSRMAAHITAIMRDGTPVAGAALVETIACVPTREGQ